MKCHYELLGVETNATDFDIKKAYKRKALELHPDKNRHRIEQATLEFSKIQDAYQVLIDPQERAWYDKNREKILFKSIDLDMEFKSDDDLMPFFSSSCYNSTNDEFYIVFERLFKNLQLEEMEALQDPECLPDNFVEFDVDFGNAKTDFSSLKQLYNRFMGFSTCKSFRWKDQYDVFEQNQRYGRRQAEIENKNARDEARKEFNTTVRNLTQHIRKRDPRYKAYLKDTEKRAMELKEKVAQDQKRQKEEKRKKMQAYKEAEWTKVDENQFSEEEQDIYINIYECIVCNKNFKSQGQLNSHEKSKKHKDMVVRLRNQLMLDGEEDVYGLENNLAEISLEETSHKKNDLEKDLEETSHYGKDLEKDLEENSQERNDLDKDLEETNHERINNLEANEKHNEEFERDIQLPISNAGDGIETIQENSEKQEQSDGESKNQTREKTKKKRRANKVKAPASKYNCNVCKTGFESRTKLFEHIKKEGHASAR